MPTATPTKVSVAESASTAVQGIPSAQGMRAVLCSKAALAFGLFIAVNFLILLIEPGAYYLNCRKELNMPEKVGLWLLRKPHADLIFMGSSRPCLGFDTTVAQAALDRAHAGKNIMNMSVVATSFDFNDVLLKNWILPNHPPQMIIYGCSEFDLYGNEFKKNRYRSIWRNMPYTHTLTRWDDWREYTDAQFDEKIEFVMDQCFPLIRDRKLFRDALGILCHLCPLPVTKHPKDYLSKPANEYTDAEVCQADGNYMYYLPFYDMTKPYRDDMERFIKMVQDRHIQLLFVNMPVTKKFRGYWKDPGEQKIQVYRNLLASIAAQHNIPLLDLYDAPEDVFDPKTAFRDTNHLSKFGARVISEKVVKEMILPHLKNADPVISH